MRFRLCGTWRARRLRRYVMHNRGCPVRPGTLHEWASIDYPDPQSFGAVVTAIECVKCGAWTE